MPKQEREEAPVPSAPSAPQPGAHTKAIDELRANMDILNRHVQDAAQQVDQHGQRLLTLERGFNVLLDAVTKLKARVDAHHPLPKHGNCPKCGAAAGRPGYCGRCGNKWETS